MRRPAPSALEEVARRFRESAARRAKASIEMVSDVLGSTDWLSGPGDDAAALPSPGSGFVLAAGEAILPSFVQSDPYGAGIAAVVTNANDVAAMGGRVLGLVDTIVGPEALARDVLRGIERASYLYDIPVIGGHLTVRDGDPAVSAFVVGEAGALLASRNAAPGQQLLVATALEGRMHPTFPFFSAVEARGQRLARDLHLLPHVAERGWCVAAKDVSMGGMLGSLAMLLEPTATGAMVDLDRIPRPDHVPLAEWTGVFPSFGFLLCTDPKHVTDCVRAFRARGLSCEAVGVLEDGSQLRVRLGTDTTTLIDLASESVTGLRGDRERRPGGSGS